MDKLCNEIEKSCGSRREFLLKVGIIAGGVVLSFSGVKNVLAQEEETITLAIDEKSKLNKVGGSQTIKTKIGKILVVRTGESEYKAFSAKCPHKGGPIRFDSNKNQLSCSWHDSIFGLDGKNNSGPAKTPLSVYSAESAEKSVVIKTEKM